MENFSKELAQSWLPDQAGLRKRWQRIQQRQRQGKPVDQSLTRLQQDLAASQAKVQQRGQACPPISYPETLPVVQMREEIAAAIAEHQVVILAGETGSGKTTQLPKICLQLGRGRQGLIGHTQPRRIAARSVAQRIAEELRVELGQQVGYKVRFSDHSQPQTLVKLMTDGILLAEIQQDPMLYQYDTLIIDEAHERSLNIDFLLGYLKRLLPQRPELKLIITSATIDPERFAQHFAPAPIVSVPGRSYPVTLRYAELEADQSLHEGVVAAVDSLLSEPLGDILIFLATERDIREVMERLNRQGYRDTEVVPLFARLSVKEQQRIFQPHRGRRIVLATNVAETSLTVPGIRYVIDSGLARISRYSYRTQVQRLPIEPISQASAKQRAGRCGRTGPGLCIRLYTESDLQLRPEFTEPEILRTNLAAVLLQMQALRLGDIADYPFVQPPDKRFINDGYKLLHELEALTAQRRLTAIGKQLMQLPLDPRLARMLVAANALGCVAEVLVIVSGLSVQDPRERPLDKQQAATEKHRQFAHPESDFLSYLQLWQWFKQQQAELSNNQLRKACQQQFIVYLRMREWQDILQQLQQSCQQLGWQWQASETPEYERIHRALLAGLLGHIGQYEEQRRYLGARSRHWQVFPGSGLAKKTPKWLMAGSLMETQKCYGRDVAKIEPAWIERQAQHLLKRHYFEPHWEKRRGYVVAFERTSLYGLVLNAKRKVNYAAVDPEVAREIFIRDGLVAGQLLTRGQFLAHNQALFAELETLEHKGRRRDLVMDEVRLQAWYAARIPEQVVDLPSFEKWRKTIEREQPRHLYLSEQDILQRETAEVTAADYPDHLQWQGVSYPLVYQFEPGQEHDGVTLQVPLPMLGHLAPEPLQWLVPGLLSEKLEAMIRALPKRLRKHFVPAPEYAQACRDVMPVGQGDLYEAMAAALLKMTGVAIDVAEWRECELPTHLRMKIALLDSEGQVLTVSDDLAALRSGHQDQAQAQVAALPTPEYQQTDLTSWPVDALPEQVALQEGQVTLTLRPGLVDRGKHADLMLHTQVAEADYQHHWGVVRLLQYRLSDQVGLMQKTLKQDKSLGLYFAPVGRAQDLYQELVDVSLSRACLSAELPRDASAFAQCVERGRGEVYAVFQSLHQQVQALLKQHHQLQKQLNGKIPLALATALADIKAHLQRLIYPGFVRQCSVEQLAQYSRYLKASEVRLERLQNNPSKDNAPRQQLAALESVFWQKYAQIMPYDPKYEAVQAYRWLLEEWRLSLFAQPMKAKQPVSEKRLRAFWQQYQL